MLDFKFTLIQITGLQRALCIAIVSFKLTACSKTLQFAIEDVNSSVVYEFDAGVWIKMDAYNDFWQELPLKKLKDQLPGKKKKNDHFGFLLFDSLILMHTA